MKLMIALVVLLPLAAAASEAPFDPGQLDYAVNFNGTQVDWHTFGHFVLPGNEYEIRVLVDADTNVDVETSDGALFPTAPLQWRWRAPAESGLYPIHIQPEGHAVMTLNVVVMVPASEVRNGYLDGYRIGQYPDQPLHGNPIYLPPPGFVEVTPELADMAVSPHFTLGQFLCKQQSRHWPKKLVLREDLVFKLEIILAETNRRGIRTDSFHVMSGYRTPWYNESIGNGRYSRHIWGGAADIFIDTDGNGRMDDLDGNGQSDTDDARILLDIVDNIYQTQKYQSLHGGLGLYGPRPHRGPFIHVDARGQEARWSVF